MTRALALACAVALAVPLTACSQDEVVVEAPPAPPTPTRHQSDVCADAALSTREPLPDSALDADPPSEVKHPESHGTAPDDIGPSLARTDGGDRVCDLQFYSVAVPDTLEVMKVSADHSYLALQGTLAYGSVSSLVVITRTDPLDESRYDRGTYPEGGIAELRVRARETYDEEVKKYPDATFNEVTWPGAKEAWLMTTRIPETGSRKVELFVHLSGRGNFSVFAGAMVGNWDRAHLADVVNSFRPTAA